MLGNVRPPKKRISSLQKSIWSTITLFPRRLIRRVELLTSLSKIGIGIKNKTGIEPYRIGQQCKTILFIVASNCNLYFDCFYNVA